jgi:hypothetical protein
VRNRSKELSRASSNYATEANVGSVETRVSVKETSAVHTAGAASSQSRGGTSRPSAPSLTHERVAERARALWLASGCAPGQDERNWCEAEAQLRAELKTD